MDGFIARLPGAGSKTQLLAGYQELSVYFSPLPHAHEGQKMRPAIFLELILGLVLSLVFIVIPQIYETEKIRILVVEL